MCQRQMCPWNKEMRVIFKTGDEAKPRERGETGNKNSWNGVNSPDVTLQCVNLYM